MINIDLDQILSQKPPMRLLEKIISHSQTELVAGVTIRESSYGYQGEGVPSWFGIEYMAQSIAAYSNLQISNPWKPEIGFLVSVRNYKISTDIFPLGAEIQIVVVPTFIVDNSGSFGCQILVNGSSVVSAMITTYKPSSVFLEKLKEEISEQ